MTVPHDRALTLTLPDFPWDSLAPFAATAREHPSGIVDLSIGSPVDETPKLVQDAAAAALDAHSYPQTIGTPALRAAIIAWFARRRGVTGLTGRNVLPTIGSKEFIAGLPLWLGLGPGDTVVFPAVAYPTYAIGAALVGATALAEDDPALWPEGTRLVWVNSPGNPDGRVLSVDELRAAVNRARELGAVIVSDECYAELAWDDSFSGRATPSILDPAVIGQDRSSVLAIYSLSKQSNLAGYRAAFAAGCGDLLDALVALRKHLGLIVPTPVQAAMTAALGDDSHVDRQREIYRHRRNILLPALVSAGFRIDHSQAGLYLWATRGDDAWTTVASLARIGILVGPGAFYGAPQHVRFALTATDERISEAANRLPQLASAGSEPGFAPGQPADN